MAIDNFFLTLKWTQPRCCTGRPHIDLTVQCRGYRIYKGGAPEVGGGLGGQPGQQVHERAVHLVELAAQRDVAQLSARACAAHLPHVRACRAIALLSHCDARQQARILYSGKVETSNDRLPTIEQQAPVHFQIA